MNEVTRLLSAIDKGESHAAEELLPLVYDELRRLAAVRMAQEIPGQTLQATSLVHEAYLRLVDVENVQRWDSRGHFFAAAAEAMRRILIDKARSKHADKRSARGQRLDLDQLELPATEISDDLLVLDEALTELEQHDEATAKLVKLRYYAGLTHQEAAEALGLTRRAADRLWSLARAWLCKRIDEMRSGEK
jgi:RNA polymerase sigma factor (TIGR02999 family)